MADLHRPQREPRAVTATAGFTLVEMMAALGILLVGITALLGALSSSISQRRTSDARLAAAAMAEQIMHRLQFEALQLPADASSDLDVVLAPLADQDAPYFDGMHWTATTTLDEHRPDLWLVTVRVTWLEEGEDTSVEFLRAMPRQMPLAQRVRRFRENDPTALR